MWNTDESKKNRVWSRLKDARKVCAEEGVEPSPENLKAAIDGRSPRVDRFCRRAYLAGLLLRPTVYTLIIGHFVWYHGQFAAFDCAMLIVFWASSQGFLAIRTRELW